MRLSLPRLTLVLIATALAGGAVIVGLRLSTALDQFSANIAPPSNEADVARHDGAAAMAPARVEADAVATEHAIDEREFSLEYFGHEVSLNDIGELAMPDPEFERAIRARANEYGEIEAAD